MLQVRCVFKCLILYLFHWIKLGILKSSQEVPYLSPFFAEKYGQGQARAQCWRAEEAGRGAAPQQQEAEERAQGGGPQVNTGLWLVHSLNTSRWLVHRSNVEVKAKVGLQRLSALADKLIWVKENLPALVEEDGQVSKG